MPYLNLGSGLIVLIYKAEDKMVEERKFGEVFQEALDNDSKMKELKKKTWDLQEQIQKINLQKSELTGKLVVIKNEIVKRKMEIREEIRY